MTVLTLSVDQRIYYSNRERLPVDTVVKSLLAADSLLTEMKPAIRALFPDVDIKEINIYVDKIESGSIINDLFIDMVFGGEDEYKKFRQKLCKYSGKIIVENSTEEALFMKQLMGLIIAGGLAAGITWAIASNGEPIPAPVSTYNTTINNIVIGESASQNSLSGEQIQQIIASTTDKKKVAKAAINFASPAKDDPAATISINENDHLTLNVDLIKSTPAEYTPPTPEEKPVPYANVPVFITASDSRARRKGWAGSAPGIVDKAMRIVIADDVDPSKLHGNVNINADIAVIQKYNASKKQYEAKEILIKNWSPRT